ncbi:MAG TPA: hypothetical protein VMD03_06640 [Steroidobacteraceae bacterium]|nr:hypothetical protein [Steroidobacteraceae bacterium]
MQLRSTVRYLAYPANLASLIFIVLASLALTFASWGGLFGLPLLAIMLTWTLKYGLVTVEHIAGRVVGEPVLSVEMLNPLEQKKSFMQLIVVAEMFGITWAADYWFGRVAGAVVALFAIALLPAVIAIQTVTDTALKGLDPLEWYRIIRWLKGGYVHVLVSVCVLWLLAVVLFSAPVRSALPLIVPIALVMFGWLSVLALLGGVILEKRMSDPEDPPIEPVEREVSADEIARLRDLHIDRIYGEWRSGARKNAWETLMGIVAQGRDAIDELRWLYQRISTWPESRLAGRVAQELVPRLLAASRYSEAITITRQRLTADPEYRPLTAQDALQMARVARDGGDRPTARGLLRDFQRTFPNDPLQSAADELARELQR